MNWFPNYHYCLFTEEPYPQQRDDINAELSNSSESIFLRKFDRFQLQHQPYPVMMQHRDHRLPLSSRNVRMSTHENSHLVKSQSLSPLESMNNAQQMPKANYSVNDAMYLARSRSTSLTLKPNTTIVHHITSKTGEDSSQSSLNLSASSGYLSGSSSANSSNLNLSGRSSSSSTYVWFNWNISFYISFESISGIGDSIFNVIHVFVLSFFPSFLGSFMQWFHTPYDQWQRCANNPFKRKPCKWWSSEQSRVLWKIANYQWIHW